MTPFPFVWVCLLVFGLLAAAAFESEMASNDPVGKAMLAFCVFMAVWAAGILMQPGAI